MTQPIERLMDRYSDAWNRHDIDGILALHTEDSVFENHTSGGRSEGHAAIRTMLEGIFATFPDLRFEARHRSVSEDLAIIAWTASATFTCPITRAGCTYSPTGKRLVWNGLDVIPIRDGRVLRKDVYVDSESFERQLAAAAA
jgi:steroid delta-isomerase-like uncharacterized protein